MHWNEVWHYGKLKKYKFVQAPDTEVGLKGSIHVTTVRYYPYIVLLPMQTIVGLTMNPKNGVFLKILPRD